MKNIIHTLFITCAFFGGFFSNSMHAMKRLNPDANTTTQANQIQQIQPFSWLPIELTDKIAGQCNAAEKDLMNQVCQTWRERLHNKEMILFANPDTVTQSHKLKKMFEYVYSRNAQKLAIWLSVLVPSDINGAIDSVDYSPDLDVDRNPLEIAIENNDIESVRVLIQYGANVNNGEENGYMTPLMVASLWGHTQIAQLLLDHGAHVNYTDNEDDTSLTLASRKGHIDTVKLLLDRKANVNQADIDGWTPLITASFHGHIEVVRLLLSHGADVNQADDAGRKLLYEASKNGHIKVVQLLLDRKANVNQADEDGWTPLIAASSHGHTEVVQLLLNRNANIHQAVTADHWNGIEEGDTALDIAQKKGYTQIVKLIQEQLDLEEIEKFWA